MKQKVSNPKQKPDFEDFGFMEHNKKYWLASWYAKVLGYSSLNSLKKTIEKSKLTCLLLGIDIDQNFIYEAIDNDKDLRLTKFACFIISLHADGRKKYVKSARSYFLNELEEMNLYISNENFLKRIIMRNELKGLNKDLNKIAARALVRDFQHFTNEGYLGLYNMTSSQIKEKRNLSPEANIIDYMDVTELASNLFRITVTQERLKRINNPSEMTAAREHWKIGSQIRSIIKENTGLYPENLPIKENIKQLQKQLKRTQKELNTSLIPKLN